MTIIDQLKDLETFTRTRTTVTPGPLPLALVFDPTVEGPMHEVSVVAWSEPVQQRLVDLARVFAARQPRQSLPVESLRARLEVLDPENLRLDRDLGRRGGALLWTPTPLDAARARVCNALLGWLIDDVNDDGTGTAVIQQLRGMATDGSAVAASRRRARVFAWQPAGNGTATPVPGVNPNGYPDLADYVARQLEGKDILPGLGPVRRIASGQLDRNQAELITEPITDQRSPFSIVIRVRVLGFPGRPAPVVVVELARRVWVQRIVRSSPLVRNLTAYAFPHAGATALSFTLTRTRNTDGQRPYTYEPSRDYRPIARAFNLPLAIPGDSLLAEGPRLPGCPLYVVHKHGIGERTPIKHGVPDADKLVAFRGVVGHLAPLGFRPWNGLKQVQTKTRSIQDRDQWWYRREAAPARWKRFEAGRDAEVAAITACYTDSHNIVLAYDPAFREDAEFAQHALTSLLQDRVCVETIPIPPGVHGPREQLEGTPEPYRERSERRVRAWEPFVTEVQRYVSDSGRRLDGILALVPEWYGAKHDDPINKRAARITLARQLGVPVQYLRPLRDDRNEKGDEELRPKFEHRLFMAWRDLVWRTIGRVNDSKLLEAATHIYRTADGRAGLQPPDRVLAIGVLRRNQTRALFNDGSFVPFAIELHVAKGTCEARYAHEQGSTMAISDRKPLPEVLTKIASHGPIQLSTDPKSRRDQRRERASQFFHEAITDFCKRAEHPLLLVDAVACRDVWPWVADTRLDAENVIINTHGHVEADWGDLRIVRIRTDNAPKVLFDHVVEGVGAISGEVVVFPSPHGADADLFRMQDTPVPVYLSFGSLMQTSLVGGVSCYRTIVGLKRHLGRPTTYTQEQRAPWTRSWSTANGVEFTVVRTAVGEDPDQLAQFVEQLRTLFAHVGDWTTKPAPLYFETALREYLADYELDAEVPEAEATEDEEIEEDVEEGES